ncbi:MAG: multidrug DMT transporter permease [Bacteroidetes bacterium]|jgi:glucose uptake protein|nr:multidrug DMT transporter permease [Bacteroidota bacterium]MBT3751233.1 multidrug DMT transporter permease [Bacteroidota bacterium]MBT4397932.1 multidrug DMT transporter permease [Bacteroidota bacterium]MBT7464283.1 multidrug DMT transporter permease [Bacteroidota bacterium]
MYIISSYFVAVLFCIITMLCWGSWANTQKLSSKKWPFQLFYWDYALGILIVTLLLAFTLGSYGDEGRSFLLDIKQAQGKFIASALVSGIIFNFANLLLVIAIDIAGMAIAFPIGIGIALVLGVITNYIDNPEGNPTILFAGVLLIAIAVIFDALAYKNILKKSKQKPLKGIIISLLAGIAMGFFYKYIAQSMSLDFVSPEVGKLTPYTALVIFAVGLLASNFLFNTVNMYKPISGKAVKYKDYIKLGSPKLHLIGLLGGIIWGIGMSFSIIASEQAGPAIAYGLGQGATMIAAIWGVFIWKELKDLPKSKNWLIILMFICFILGLGLIIYSRIA